MIVYHTYEKSRGFDINKMDYERGIFTIDAWWTKDPRYAGKYSEWHPNEFGDIVVGLDIDEHVKTYKVGDQLSAIEDLFPDTPNRQKIIDKYELGNMQQEDWQKLDKIIGKQLRKLGYKLIHYTDDPMYGNTWVVISKDTIKNVIPPPSA